MNHLDSEWRSGLVGGQARWRAGPCAQRSLDPREGGREQLERKESQRAGLSIEGRGGVGGGAEEAHGSDPPSQRAQEGAQGVGSASWVLWGWGAGREQRKKHTERQRKKQAWREDSRLGRRGAGGAGSWPVFPG